MERQLKLFFNFLENDKKLSENTLQSYKRDLKQFRRYIEAYNLHYNRVKEEDIKDYIQYMQEEGKKASSISRCIASIRSFYQFALKNRKIKEDPTANIQSPKIEKRVPNVLTTKEVELLLKQPDDMDLKGIRDKAMLEFAYATGMRVTEIISLDIDDVNLEESYVLCKNGNKQRIIPLGAMSLKALKEYIEEARDILIKKEDEKALFVNINGGRLTRQGFWKIIKFKLFVLNLLYYKIKCISFKNITYTLYFYILFYNIYILYKLFIQHLCSRMSFFVYIF